MARNNLNTLTRANLLAHVATVPAIEDIYTLYGQAGGNMLLLLIAEGLVGVSSRAGVDTVKLTGEGRKQYTA